MIAAPAVFAQIGAADFTKSPLSKDPASIEAGRKLSDCHGPTGEGGRGPNLMTGRQVKRFGDDVFFNRSGRACRERTCLRHLCPMKRSGS